MTTTYGSSPTYNGVTLKVAATVSGGSVTIRPTLSATIPIWDESNTVNWSGANSGSYSGGPAIRIGSSSGGKTASDAAIKVNSAGDTTFTFNVARTTSPQDLTLTFNLVGINYAGRTLTATVGFRVPALAPGTPSGATASAAYLENGQWRTNLAWTVPAGATGIRLWRWDHTRTDLSYLNIANLGAVGQYTDASLAVDQRYGYAVSATNSGGESARYFFGGVFTPAATPTGLTAARSGTDITGSFINQSQLNPAFEIEDSTDGGESWTPVGTIARNNYAVGARINYSLSGLNATLPHRIRVRAVGQWPDPGAGTPSAWSAPSATVVIITKPNPPTGLTSGVVAWAPSLTLSAKPATNVLPDGSLLSAFEWRHRAQGGSFTTVTNNSPTSLDTTVTGYASGTNVEHQVRVKGAHADWSDWSPIALVSLSSLPVSSFTSPANGGTLQGDTLTVEVSGHDPDGGAVTAARYWLEDASGRTIVARTETTSSLNRWTFPAKLADGQQVVAYVQHRKPNGLWSTPATLTQTVAYIGPAELDVTTRWDINNAMLLWEWESLVDPDLPAPESVDVYVLQDGQRVEVATGLQPMGAWPMRLAPLVDTVYVLAIRSALPSTTWQTVVVRADPILSTCFVVNGGPGYSMAAIGRYEPDLQQTAGRARSLTDGWANSPYPREVVHEKLSDVRQIGYNVDGRDTLGDELRAVQATTGGLWWRDPTGASWPCSLSLPDRSMSSRRAAVLKATVTRTGGGPSIDAGIELVTADTVYADLIPGA